MSLFCYESVPFGGTNDRDGTRARVREPGHCPVPFRVPFPVPFRASRPGLGPRLSTFEEVDALWSYDPDTGFLRWKVNPGPKEIKGTLIGAGRYEPWCYVSVGYRGRTYSAHRLGWLLYYGRWPEHEIDHINGVRSDNRIANLRDVPHRVNQLNQKRHREAA